MSTYLSLHYHLVFSTKNRENTIDVKWRGRLHEYLGGALRSMGAYAQEVGGVADHVHLLAGLKATHCLADIMRDLKKHSSGWVRDEIGLRSFSWQEGYAAFSVSPSERARVVKYIASQETHHRTMSSRDELLKLLRLAGVEYDPQYFQ